MDENNIQIISSFFPIKILIFNEYYSWELILTIFQVGKF